MALIQNQEKVVKVTDLKSLLFLPRDQFCISRGGAVLGHHQKKHLPQQLLIGPFVVPLEATDSSAYRKIFVHNYSYLLGQGLVSTQCCLKAPQHW